MHQTNPHFRLVFNLIISTFDRNHLRSKVLKFTYIFQLKSLFISSISAFLRSCWALSIGHSSMTMTGSTLRLLQMAVVLCRINKGIRHVFPVAQGKVHTACSLHLLFSIIRPLETSFVACDAPSPHLCNNFIHDTSKNPSLFTKIIVSVTRTNKTMTCDLNDQQCQCIDVADNDV